MAGAAAGGGTGKSKPESEWMLGNAAGGEWCAEMLARSAEAAGGRLGSAAEGGTKKAPAPSAGPLGGGSRNAVEYGTGETLARPRALRGEQ